MTLEVQKASDMGPEESQLTIVAGPPGLGKSWFAGTLAEYLTPEETLLIATLPREAKSHKYQQHNLDTILCHDPEWLPSEGSFRAQGYEKLMSTLEELIDDTQYKGIILDSGTEAGELAWHSSLEPHAVSDPSEIKGRARWLPYTAIDAKLDQMMRRLTLLTSEAAAQPKIVVATWHIQPPKDSVEGESADEKGEGVEYEGKVLPMIRGRFRRRLYQLVDAIVYADRRQELDKDTMKTRMKYVLQVQPDNEKHTKVPGAMPDKMYIPNDFTAFMDLLEHSQD